MLTGGVDAATLRVRVEGGQAQAEAQRTERSLDRLGRSGMSAQRALARLGVTLSVGLAFRKIIRETAEQEHTLAQLEARLQSTGHAAGRTMRDLTDLSNALQATTTYSNEAVEGVQALLLTFTRIQGEVFDRALTTTLDLATAMGTDARSAALQLGKALNDPAQQLTALTRSGVSFTDAQRDMVRAMVEAGDIAGAQNLILEEMQTQFGGAAEAARNTFGGALAFLANQFADAFKIGREHTGRLTDAINRLGHEIPRLRDAFISLGIAMGTVYAIQFAPMAIAAAQAVAGWTTATVALAAGVKSLSTALALLQIAIGPKGWMLLGVTALTVLIYKHIRAKREEAEAIEATRQAAAREHRERMDNLATLTRKELEAQRIKLEARRAELEAMDLLSMAGPGRDFSHERAAELMAVNAQLLKIRDLLKEVDEVMRGGGDGAEDMAEGVRTLTQALEQLRATIEARAFQRAVERVFRARLEGGLVGVPGIPTLPPEPVTMHLDLPERELEEFNRRLRDFGQYLLDNADVLMSVSRSALHLADTLGILDARSRQALRGLVTLVEGIQGLRRAQEAAAAGHAAMAAAGKAGAVIAIATGLAQVVQSIISGAAATRKAAEEYNRALREAHARWQRTLRDLARDLADPGPYERGLHALERNLRQLIEEFLEAFDISPRQAEAFRQLPDDPDEWLDWLTEMQWRFALWGDASREWGAIVDHARRALEKAAEAEAARIAQIQNTLDLEQLRLEGLDEEARALERQIELQRAVADGYTEAQLAQLEHIQELREQKRAAEEAAHALRRLGDFEMALARARMEASPDDLETRRVLGELEIARTVDSFRDLVEAGIITQEELDLLAQILTDNLAAALRDVEAAALAAAEALRHQGAQFEQDVAIRELLLAGDDKGALIARLDMQAQDELFRARLLLEAGVITEEAFNRLRTVILGETLQAIEAFEQAARDAAEAAEAAARAERFRAHQDLENLRIRGLVAQGRDEEAQALRDQLELMRAIQEGRGGEYIALLLEVQALEAARRASDSLARSVRDTTDAMEAASRALNAPRGLRLSLLQWRAQDPRLGGAMFPQPTSDSGRLTQSTSFNFGKESITVVAAKGESGDELLGRILDAANRRARGGSGNVFETLSEGV